MVQLNFIRNNNNSVLYIYILSLVWATKDAVWIGDGTFDHLQTVTGSNYNAVANLHTLQITTAHAKPSQSGFASRFPVTNLSSGDSSASVLTSLLSGEYPTTELLQKSKSKLCYDRRSAGQSVLEQSTHLGLTTRS
jgi:hypothetical protein